MQNVIMLIVIMLNAIMLNVIMLNIIQLSVIMLNVIVLSVLAPLLNVQGQGNKSNYDHNYFHNPIKPCLHWQRSAR